MRWLLVFVGLACAFTPRYPLQRSFYSNLWSAYRQAIRNSMIPSEQNVVDLWTIDKSNTKLRWRAIPDVISEKQLSLNKRDEQVFHPFQDYIDVQPVSVVAGGLAKSEAPGLATEVQTTQSAVSEYVLVVTWTSSPAFNDVERNQKLTVNAPVWTTVYPQVRDACRDLSDKRYPWQELGTRSSGNSYSSDDSLRTVRMLQYHGLPPQLPTPRKYFALLWVKPEDLVRPCLRPGLDLTRCDLTFVWNTTEGVKLQASVPPDEFEAHQNWFQNMVLRTDVYNFMAPNGNATFPWTRLGYTYDWGSSFVYDGSLPGVGASEFVIKQGAEIYVDRVENLFQHCK